MPDTLLLIRLPAAMAMALCLASTAVTSQTPGTDDEDTTPAYVLRGDHVEATYEAYLERLGRYQTRLRSHLEAAAPDLAKKLETKPPTPVEYGYLVVPTLTLAEPSAPAKPRAAVYSWPWTKEMLDSQQATLSGAEQTLDRVDSMTPEKRRATYEQLTDGYDALGQGQRLVDQHLKHNRFWQRVIDEDRGRFERQLVLYEAVVERERLTEQLRGTGVTAETRTSHNRQIGQLDTQIEDGQPAPAAPGYIQVIENSARRRVLRVPLYTDIPDTEFVAASVAAIESAWSIEVDGLEYRLELDLAAVNATTEP